MESSPENKTPFHQRISRKTRNLILAVGACIFIVLIGNFIWKQVTPSRWITISYADLLDRNAIIRTGQELGSALYDDSLRSAVQPFVDGYSELLPYALEMTIGPDKRPSHNVLDFFPSGEQQPAWVAILRGGRIHIVTDDKTHVKVFLLGDDPTLAYSQNYSVVRHCLTILSGLADGEVNIDVFAYQNDYANSELRLNTKPYTLREKDFKPKKPSIDLAALSAFFMEGPEIQGAALNKNEGLVLYGTEVPKQTLAGYPIELSDLAVAYRAVFHAGDNEAFISLDPNKDPTKTTVNFGGFLENTRLGSVVLEADKRFKTITSGLDPNTSGDLREYTRQVIPTFLSGAERDLLADMQSAKGQWIGTRFWYYPDAIGVDSDLNYNYAVISNPRFTADAERSREDFSSPEEFEHKKRNTLSPSIRASIDNLNQNYDEYAKAFPEISELTSVARLMGICSWLYKANPTWINLDELLAIELPSCTTETERTQLIAATFLSSPKAEVPNKRQIVKESKIVFLSPILDKTVQEVFKSPSDISRYLMVDTDSSTVDKSEINSEATSLFTQYQNQKVREMVHTKRDLQRLADYAANEIDVPVPSSVNNLEARIKKDESALEALDTQIELIKNRIDTASSRDDHNFWVDRHNRLINEYETVRKRLNQSIDQYNNYKFSEQCIIEIGGGINLEPSKFAIRQNPSSRKLIEFKDIASKVGLKWTQMDSSKKWIRSGKATGDGLGVKSQATVNKLLAVSENIKRWTKIDSQDGSWRTAVRLDSNCIQEQSYNAQQQALQVAEFTDTQLKSLIIAQRDSDGRIIFKEAMRQNVIPPADPPAWYKAK